MTPTLSPLAAALARTVAAADRVRVPVETLRQSALAADLSLHGAPDARRRLLAAITELVDAGHVTLPAAGRTGWEPAPRPPLPRWVSRPAPPKAAAPTEQPVSWHAGLSWVPAFTATDRPSAKERALLRAVNAFLGAGGSKLVVPLRERSLQLTGDEKSLDALSRGRLFSSGRLTLELILARRTSPPVARHRIGCGPVTLLVENWSTYESLTATLPADGEIGTVAYSAGNSLGAVLTVLADDPPAALAYFGDLDVRGLEIAAAGARLVDDLGLPPLLPAAGLYRLLMDHGLPADTDADVTPAKVRKAVVWLPAELRPPAEAVLMEGKRVAQEAVGLELLTGTPATDLAAVTTQRR
ncbi:hypothetical protein SAMN05660209_03299 [Geodermatophilus africanus]|uniref:Wadjet protein JetD C-terminal domain-containing protein n=1 Tax=Geodermatophilus africanus TaxID=1137993 RepID=A0A1H3LD14_9ACTN|nr:hypothetical protein [Geodermatophilus africanus]SDY62467.1 hypothetical protein SAMN05660209_03299 [Geodermatophilus africanus]